MVRHDGAWGPRSCLADIVAAGAHNRAVAMPSRTSLVAVAATGLLRRRDARELALATLVALGIAGLQIAAPDLHFVGGVLSLVGWTILGRRAGAGHRVAATVIAAWAGLLSAGLTSIGLPPQSIGNFDGMQVCRVEGAYGAMVLWPLLGAALTCAVALSPRWLRVVIAFASVPAAFWIGLRAYSCAL